jgi:S1-C subfamily serine protease
MTPAPGERVAAATVRVTGADGTGSGIVVDPRGLVLTACHVIDEEEVDDPVGSEVVIALSVRPDETPRELLFAEVIAADTEDDLALLRVTGDVFGRGLAGWVQAPVSGPW